jgi:hypothetical protein
MWLKLVGVLAVLAIVLWIFIMPKSSPCGRPTSGVVALTVPPEVGVTFNGAPLIGAADLKINSAQGITLTNISASPIDFNAVELYQSIDNAFIPPTEVKPECSTMGIVSNDCLSAGSPTTLAPGASCTIMVKGLKHQTGFLRINTSLAQPFEIPLAVRP